MSNFGTSLLFSLNPFVAFSNQEYKQFKLCIHVCVRMCVCMWQVWVCTFLVLFWQNCYFNVYNFEIKSMIWRTALSDGIVGSWRIAYGFHSSIWTSKIYKYKLFVQPLGSKQASSNRISKYRSVNCKIDNLSFSEWIIGPFDWLKSYSFTFYKLAFNNRIIKKTSISKEGKKILSFSSYQQLA